MKKGDWLQVSGPRGIMDTILFGSYTVTHLLMAAGAAVAAFILFQTVKDLFKKKKPSPYVQDAECRTCGWRGKVSRLAGRCPVCNSPLGDGY